MVRIAALGGAALLVALQGGGVRVAHATSTACTMTGPPPSSAAVRTCLGLTAKERVQEISSPDGDFKLHSPFVGVNLKGAPGCGQAEGHPCIPNHWDWTGPLLTVYGASGTCSQNNPLCEIDGLPGGAWTVVYVSLDDNNQGNLVAFVLSTGKASSPCAANPTACESLSISLALNPASDKLGVGSTANLIATVKAVAAPVNNVKIALKTGGPTAAITSVPPTAGKGVNLQKGGSFLFPYQLRGLKTGHVTISATATGTGAHGKVSVTKQLQLTVGELAQIHVLTNDVANGTINLHYHGSGFDASGGPISFTFSGQKAGQRAAASQFDGVLRIAYWPKRTTDEAVLGKGAAGGYCSGELAAHQGAIQATTGTIQGKFAGWVLWSADPRIKAREAWCQGEDQTLLAASPFPIVVFGYFSGERKYGVRVFNLDGPAGPPSQIFTPGPGQNLNVGVTRSNVCVRIAVSPQATLSVSTTPGKC